MNIARQFNLRQETLVAFKNYYIFYRGNQNILKLFWEQIVSLAMIHCVLSDHWARNTNIWEVFR